MNNKKEEQQNTVNAQQQQAVQTPNQQQQPRPEQIKASTTQEGFNLIPALSQEEKVKIKKKNTFNIGSILSVILLAAIAIGIVSFNILSKAQLNSRKNSLARLEKRIYENIDKIANNNAILERVRLYEKFKKGSFSHKMIIEFLQDVANIERANKRGRIVYTSIEIAEDLSFKASGLAPNLEQVAYLWYLFGVDESVESIALKSVSKDDEGSRFSFEGVLNISNFSNE